MAPADAPNVEVAVAAVVVVVAMELPVVAGVVVEPAGTVEVAATDVVPAASGVVVVVPPGTVEEVVGTGTTGEGPRPVHTVVEVVDGGTVVSRRVVEVLVRVCVTGTLGGVSVMGGAVVSGAAVVGGGAAVVVELAGTDVVGDDVGGELVLAACRELAVETFPAPEDLATEELATEELATEELGVEELGVEGRGADVVVAGRVVVVVLDATPACGPCCWAALVVGTASSSCASCEISLPCLAISFSSTAMSLASEAAVALAETVLAGIEGTGPARPDWITFVALLMSAAAAATLCCDDARRASVRYFSAEARATCAFWY